MCFEYRGAPVAIQRCWCTLGVLKRQERQNQTIELCLLIGCVWTDLIIPIPLSEVQGVQGLTQ